MTPRPRATTAVPPCLVAALLTLAGTARAQSPLFEVEKSDATKLLQLHDDAGFLIRGAVGTGTIPATGAGVRLMWYPGKAAFRAGEVHGPEWDEPNVGRGSVALGWQARATGESSVALNRDTEASGLESVAGGYRSIASGPQSLAIGGSVVASARGAVALGSGSVASGLRSFAAGDEPKAAGAASVALGSGVTAQGDGSFAFGDRNVSFPVTAGPNEFWVRAFGGIGLNTGVNIGCDLPANTGAWSCTSSKLVKEAFEDVDGEEILARLREIPIQRWRYIGTDARHLGPFAEDFHAAFGLGESAERIAQIDADGVALSGVQALERRTAALQTANATLQAQNDTIRAELAALRELLSAAVARPGPGGLRL